MRALVVGATGLVGSRLVPVLVAQGVEVTATARREAQGALPGVRWCQAELGVPATLEAAVAAARPEVIVNCAGLTDVDGCERAPEQAWVANVEGVASLARLARGAGAHLVHVSTDYVFDGEAGPYRPDAIPNP
jgi:dTDP-4-dehydrorhamnose reductase